MTQESDDRDGADGPLIRLIIYICFIIGGAVGGALIALFSNFELLSDQQAPLTMPELIVVLSAGALLGAVAGYGVIRQASRMLDN